MNVAQPKLGLDGPYVNTGLFADNFLENRLVEMDEWQRDSDEKLASLLKAISEIYAKREIRLTGATKETQTEKYFIMPVLDLLWNEPGGPESYEIQEGIPFHGSNERRIPDYVFFESAKAKSLAEPLKETTDYWKTAIALGDAKRWGQSLDKMRGKETPSAQITNYLYRAKVRWGILTNGIKWRLYEEDKSRGGGNYFEMDLVQIIQQKDLKGFRLFYLFFGRQSFVPESGTKPFVEQVLAGSAEYAATVSGHLKESVYDALRSVMNGIFAEEKNGVSADNPADLEHAHGIALIILYRLLFLMYAEDRKLLPVEINPYKAISLHTIHKEINKKLNDGESYSPGTFIYWPRIQGLWEKIDFGYKPNGKWIIPAYNGGLFSPENHPEIPHSGVDTQGSWRVGDRYLADAIDMLGYTRDTWNEPGSKDIDYATLDVRHLGSIYEGLLELAPALAECDLVEVWDGKKLAFKPVAEVTNAAKKVKGQPPRRIAKGEVYLVTDRGERKASGSYYTPEYIVNYIVEHTIGPLAKEAHKQTEALFGTVVDKIDSIKKQQAEKNDSVRKYNDALRLARQEILKPYLDLNILDPAMGSGHFLVGAADFLSREIAFDEAVSTIYEEQGLDDPQAHFKRLVVEHCLYGVDLNPLAVELAKLSLWLHTVSRDKALSFLDHHLHVGNSLIGARLEDDLAFMPPAVNPKLRKKQKRRSAIEREIGGFRDALEETSLAWFLEKFRQIIERPNDTAKDEHAKQQIYAKLDKVRAKYRAVANLWLAPFFGVEVSDANYIKAITTLKKGTVQLWKALETEKWFKAAQAVAREKDFFHWELAFPEVFFEEKPGGTAGYKPKDQRGFDAVIGNPPYVRQEGLGADKPAYEYLWDSVYHGVADIYVYFYGRGLSVLNHGGGFGMITSNKFMRSNYGKPLRNYLASKAEISEIIDFGDLPVFPEATAYPCIVRLGKAKNGETRFTQIKDLDFEKLDIRVANTSSILPTEAFEGESWSLGSSEEVALLRKLESSGISLKQYLADHGTEINRGVLTGFNKAFIIDKETRDKLIAEDPKSAEIIKPLVVGDDVRHYEVNFRERYLIWTYIGVPIDKYPAIFNHLKQYQKKLEKRWDKGKHWWELRACDYYADFEMPKIIYPDISISPKFSRDNDGLFSINTTYFFVSESDFLISLLNSKLLFHYHYAVSTKIRGDYLRYFGQYIEQLPIRKIEFTTPKDERVRLVDQVKALYGGYLTSGDNAQVLAHVARCLGSTPVPGGGLVEDTCTEAGATGEEEGNEPTCTEAGATTEKADVVHDLLAHLAEEMTRLNKEKQQAIRDFLGWFCDVALSGQGIEELTGKTKLKEYYKHDVTTLVGELRKGKNKKLLAARGVDASTASFHKTLNSEHEKSVARLAPLLANIQATDELIDQVVYKLYGLTDDEIAIVEGVR